MNQPETEPNAIALSRRLLLRRGLGVGLTGLAAGAMVTGWRLGGGEPASAFAPLMASPAADCVASPAASPSPIAGESSPTAGVTVRMTAELRFDPEDLHIQLGESVTWVNDSEMPHTATDDPEKNPVGEAFPDYATLPSGADAWDSGILQPGESFTYQFTVPGDYAYFCIPHVLSGMRGTIQVGC